MDTLKLLGVLADHPTPSWDLDCKIGAATNKMPLDIRRYTSNLMDAIGLLPWGWAWMVGCAAGDKFFATVQTTEEGGMEFHDITAESSTPALAMTIAALRAWEHTKDQAPWK